MRYVRTTGASRRAARVRRYVHVSKEFVVDDAGPLARVKRYPGRTRDVRRNEWKRLRQAAERGEATPEMRARGAEIERAWREGRVPENPLSRRRARGR